AEESILKKELRNNVVGILKNSKIQHSNITKEEQSAMTVLCKNEQIIILPADKGRTTLVMDKEKYKQQMLEDKNTYKILKEPTENVKKNIKKLLKPLQEKGKITEKMYKHWIPTANIIPRIYGTPKIHKQSTPLRPIVDSIGTPTYNITTIEDNDILISHDVTSLFTKTPTQNNHRHST
uniref:Reverse transcriptase domain-containing protein n=1 Tax=Nothobranchius furzeri TaxID=105023 RepID=A0A8C6KE86_NOTFU